MVSDRRQRVGIGHCEDGESSSADRDVFRLANWTSTDLHGHRPCERSFAGSPPRLREPETDLVALRRARDRIDREFDHPLHVESIARAVGMSAGHFSRRFRAEYGEPPHTNLMTLRVERAMARYAAAIERSPRCASLSVQFAGDVQHPLLRACRTVTSAHRSREGGGSPRSLLVLRWESRNRSGIVKQPSMDHRTCSAWR